MIKFYQSHCDSYYKSFAKTEAFFKAKESRIKALSVFGKLSTVIVYAVYIIMLAVLAVRLDIRIVRAIAVPAVIFVITTLIRSGINAPRPYEKYPIKSLVHKSTKGNSCPSRHSACAFAIAFACLYVNTPAGIFMLILASMIAVSRPLMGVHFPLDVIFGTALAALLSLVGYIIL